MVQLTMKNLENCFKEAKRVGAKYIGISIQIGDYPKPEIIINPIENWEEKLKYYQYTYDEELTLNGVIKIVGFTYGWSFDDIEGDLV